MYLFGEKIKGDNIWRIIILAILSIIWRLRFKGEIALADKYFLPVAGFFVGAIVLGELTRKLLRLYKIQRVKPKANRRKEDAEDIEALNYAIGWSVVFIAIS